MRKNRGKKVKHEVIRTPWDSPPIHFMVIERVHTALKPASEFSVFVSLSFLIAFLFCLLSSPIARECTKSLLSQDQACTVEVYVHPTVDG